MLTATKVDFVVDLTLGTSFRQLNRRTSRRLVSVKCFLVALLTLFATASALAQATLPVEFIPRSRSSDEINQVDYSRNSRLLISTAGDQFVRVWDAATGALMRVFRVEGNGLVHNENERHGILSRFVLAPDSKTMLMNGYVWDLATGKPIGSFGAYDNAAFSPDGRTLAFASGGQLTLRNLETNSVIKWFGSERQQLNGPVVFSPDGRLLAAATGGSGYVWSVETAQRILKFDGDGFDVASLAFSPDGTKLAVGEAGETVYSTNTIGVKLIDLRSKRILAKTPSTLLNPVWDVAFLPDGKRLISSEGFNNMKIWDPKTGELLRAFKPTAPEASVKTLSLSQDGRSVATGSDRIRIWDIETGQQHAEFNAEASEVDKLAYTSRNKLLIAGDTEGTLFFWDMTSGQLLAAAPDSKEPGSKIVLSHDGRLALVAVSGKLKIWDVRAQYHPRTRHGECHRILFH